MRSSMYLLLFSLFRSIKLFISLYMWLCDSVYVLLIHVHSYDLVDDNAMQCDTI